MTKINENDLVDYVDGTLDVARLALVEAHLRANAEDAELVSSMKFAQGALQDWNEDEPVKVSPDFWMKVRDQLPAQPERSWTRSFGAQLRAWLWPAQSPLGMSMRVAAVAAFCALAALFLAPQRNTQVVTADPQFGTTQRLAPNSLTPDEQSFIKQSLDRHSAYVSSQPLSGPALIVPGDSNSAEHGDDSAGHDQTP